MTDLSIMQSHTIADALTAWALSPTSTDARIVQVIDALRAIEYTETADTLERMQNGKSAVVELIESYSVRA